MSKPEGAPDLLLAKTWEGQSLIGWHLSEKLDGARALWDGTKFVTRLGNQYYAPDWFVHDFPSTQLDGELWMGRGRFSELIGCVKRHEPNKEQWEQVRYLVFDTPLAKTPFEDRIEIYTEISRHSKNMEAVPQLKCTDDKMLIDYMSSVIKGGGEGLMAREPGSLYIGKRSSTLLKIKQMQDAEAVVYEYQEGKGRNEGRMGALMCRFPNGVTFKIGTGFSDEQRDKPPVIGSTVTVRFQELSKDGVPRFPAFVGVRDYE